MITRTAKSRTAANENMINALLKEEQKNHLPYVLPLEPEDDVYDGDEGEIKLANFLTQHLTGRKPPNASQPREKGITLTKPSRRHEMDRMQRRCLREYLHSHHQLVVQNDETAAPSDSEDDSYKPERCQRFAGARFVDFYATAERMRRANSTRCNSVIRYEYRHPQDNSKCSAFGRVLFFFQVSMDDGSEHTLAFISKLNVNADERLVFVVSESGHRMINVDDIAELIGIIAWEGREYLLNKKTSLILPAI